MALILATPVYADERQPALRVQTSRDQVGDEKPIAYGGLAVFLLNCALDANQLAGVIPVEEAPDRYPKEL